MFPSCSFWNGRGTVVSNSTLWKANMLLLDETSWILCRFELLEPFFSLQVYRCWGGRWSRWSCCDAGRGCVLVTLWGRTGSNIVDVLMLEPLRVSGHTVGFPFDPLWGHFGVCQWNSSCLCLTPVYRNREMCHAFVRPPQIHTFVHWLDFLEGDTLKTMLIRSCCFLWIRHREWTSDRKRGRDFRGRVWQQEVSVCLLILHVENNTWCLWSSTMIIVLTAFWVGTVQTGSSGSYLLIETSWMFLWRWRSAAQLINELTSISRFMRWSHQQTFVLTVWWMSERQGSALVTAWWSLAHCWIQWPSLTSDPLLQVFCVISTFMSDLLLYRPK